MPSLVTSYLAQVHELRVRNHPKFPMTLEGLLLKLGHSFTPEELPKGVQLGLPKQCYQNSLSLARRRKDLIYCEGYAVPNSVDIPLEHAWCVDHTGKVVDPTWAVGKEYVGIAFQTKYAVDTVRRVKMHGLLNNYLEKWPLLTMEPKEYAVELPGFAALKLAQDTATPEENGPEIG